MTPFSAEKICLSIIRLPIFFNSEFKKGDGIAKTNISEFFVTSFIDAETLILFIFKVFLPCYMAGLLYFNEHDIITEIDIPFFLKSTQLTAFSTNTVRLH